jgi:hypothetical protein
MSNRPRDIIEVTSSGAIGYKDKFGREVIYCSPENVAVILKAGGGITIAESFKVRLVASLRTSERFIQLNGKYIGPCMSLKGGGKIYKNNTRSPFRPASVCMLAFDHHGNMIIKRAHSSYIDYETTPRKIKYRFGSHSILFTKFELALIKRQKARALERRRNEIQSSKKSAIV